MKLAYFEGAQSNEDRNAGWRYFLEKTNLKPGMTRKRPLSSGRRVSMSEDLNPNQGAALRLPTDLRSMGTSLCGKGTFSVLCRFDPAIS